LRQPLPNHLVYKLTGKALMVSDEKIIKGCKKHKRRAFSLLYQKYGAVLLGVCVRYIRNRSKAEDVLQEGFIKIYQKIGTFEGRGSFEGWMKRIMVNTAINYLKSNKKFRLEEEFNSNSVDHSQDAFEDERVEVDREINQEALIGIINELPSGYKLVFNMYVMEGYAHQEIADSLGISVGTSKSQLSKAKRYLRERVNRRNLTLKRV